MSVSHCVLSMVCYLFDHPILGINEATVVFGVLVVHWLTFGSTKSNGNSFQSATIGSSLTAIQIPSMPEPVMTMEN